MPSDYPLAPALKARVAGALVIGLGLLLVALTVVVVLAELSPSVVVVAFAVVAGVGLVAGYLLTRTSTPVVRLDDEGYRVRFVRGAGVDAARWRDVEDAVATTVAGERCIVLRLRDGRTTTVPVRMLAGRPEDFVRDLQGHLDRGHGYRRLT